MQYIIREKDTPLSRGLMIEDRRGHCVYRVHGPVVRARDELHVDDVHGVEQAYIKEPILGDGRRFEIYRDRALRAQVITVGLGNLLDGFDIVVLDDDGESLQARGDMFGREFTIASHAGARVLARVHRHDGHSMRVDIDTGITPDQVLLLAAVSAIWAMTEAWVRVSARTQA